MAKFKRYDPYGMRMGYKKCMICGKGVINSCPCCVKIRLAGTEEGVREMINVIAEYTSYYVADNEIRYDERLDEWYVTIYATSQVNRQPETHIKAR